MTQPAQAKTPLILLAGPTAVGKSEVALLLAEKIGGELVSVDSMQVYRGMDIGTAKPTPEERAQVPHHLIDLVDPDEDFTVARFQRAFREALTAIEGRSHRAVLVGGTGLYLRAAIDGLTLPGEYPEARAALDPQPTSVLHQQLRQLDPVGATRMTATNRRRVVRALEVTIGSGRPFSSYGPGLASYAPTPFRLVGVALPPDAVASRIEDRYRQQLDAGFLEEAARL